MSILEKLLHKTSITLLNTLQKCSDWFKGESPCPQWLPCDLRMNIQNFAGTVYTLGQ